MIIATDICPKSGLKREISYIRFTDNIIDRKLTFECIVKYYNPTTEEFLGTNILEPYCNSFNFILTNENTLDGIGEYDYWKGPLNDMNGLLNKGFSSLDSYISYMVVKSYFKNK